MTGVTEPFHVAVRYQPDSGGSDSSHSGMVPHDQASWMPMAIQHSDEGGSLQSGEVELSHLQLWLAEAFTDEEVMAQLGESTLRWYQTLRQEISREGVEGYVEAPPSSEDSK